MTGEQVGMTPKEVQAVEQLWPHWQYIAAGLVNPSHDTEADVVFGEIIQRYRTGDGRSYHNIVHISRMLAFVDKFRHLSKNDLLLKAAIFGHDIVYVPGSQTNEEDSAEVFGRMMNRMDVRGWKIDETERLIRVTKKHKTDEDDTNGKIMIDADFSIFAASEADYDEYARGVWQEYVGSGRIPEASFRQGRKKLIEGWLSQERIFLTPEISAQLEPQARSNLQREHGRLAA